MTLVIPAQRARCALTRWPVIARETVPVLISLIDFMDADEVVEAAIAITGRFASLLREQTSSLARGVVLTDPVCLGCLAT